MRNREKIRMISIITDSTCELDKQQQEQLGITVIPLSILFGEKEYKDRIELCPEEFYKKLEETKELPTTAQINPDTFEMYFKHALEQGEEVIAILLSSKLSGNYQSAVIAKEMLETDKVHLIDSETITIGLGILVIEAAKMRNAGKPLHEIIEKIESLKGRVRVAAGIEHIKYLERGGRVSHTKALLGTALGIKPIIEVRDGIIQMEGKVRGQKKMQKHLLNYLYKNTPDVAYPIIFGHSMAEIPLKEMREQAETELDLEEVYEVIIGSTIGAHVGPEGIGLAFIEKE